jgi:hypothetical protein
VSGDWLSAIVWRWIGGEKADFWRKKTSAKKERVKQIYKIFNVLVERK